jgi:glycosyltransferase involved in cell wall biosynthesis
MRISFMIPAYNEAATIEEVLERVHALDLNKQVIVVDDGSTDATPQILRSWERRRGVVVVRQPNRGKGAAIRAAIPLIDGDIAVIQDADLEYDPVDVPDLIEPIERGAADVVFGSRLSGGRAQRAYMFWHLVGNRFLSLMTNVLFNTTLTDMETGYKAFRADVLRSLVLREDDFGIEPEITGQVCKRKLRIYELPIAYYGRTYAEGKEISWRDGANAVRVLLRVRLRDPSGIRRAGRSRSTPSMLRPSIVPRPSTPNGTSLAPDAATAFPNGALSSPVGTADASTRRVHAADEAWIDAIEHPVDAS